MIRRILFIDTETTGLDPLTDKLLEVAWCLWSVADRSCISVESHLVNGAESNAAEQVNGIPIELASQGRERRSIVFPIFDVVVAHNAEFDRSFLPELRRSLWICSKDDLEYPNWSSSMSLVPLALAHGVAVVSAHRALADVLTLTRLFERVAELVPDFDAWLARGLRPKALFEVADKRFDEKRNLLAKEKGFRWDQPSKSWRRHLAIEDATKDRLGFDVRKVVA